MYYTPVVIVGIRDLNVSINIGHLMDQMLRGVGIRAGTIHLLRGAEVT